VADHALRHEDGDELAAVVDGEGETDGVRVIVLRDQVL
jgi:hypothetical protein